MTGRVARVLRSNRIDSATNAATGVLKLAGPPSGLVQRRVKAFLIDLVVFASLIVAIGIGGSIYAPLLTAIFTPFLPFLIVPLTMLYFAAAQGGRRGASPGMRFYGLSLRQRTGGAPGYQAALFRSVAFYLTITLLTPLVLLVLFFTRGKRALHDVFIGTVIIDSSN